MRKIILFVAVAAFCLGASAQSVTRIGIIGLDTSHSTAFSKLLNGSSDDELVRKYEVVDAYPYGTRTMDGRIGTFRAITTGTGFYGGQVFLEKKVIPAGGMKDTGFF